MGRARAIALLALFVLWRLGWNAIYSTPGYTYEVGEGVYATCFFYRNNALHLWTSLCFLSGLGFVLSTIFVKILRAIVPSRRSKDLDRRRLNERYVPDSKGPDTEEPNHGTRWNPYAPPLSEPSCRVETPIERLFPSLATGFPNPLDWVSTLIFGIALVTAALFVIGFRMPVLGPGVAAMTAFFYWRTRSEAQSGPTHL